MDEIMKILLILAVLAFPLIKGLINLISGRNKEGKQEQVDRTEAGLTGDSLLLNRNTATATTSTNSTGSARPSPNRRSSRSQKSQGTVSRATSLEPVQDSQTTFARENTMISQPNVQSRVQHIEQMEHPIITLFRNQVTVQQMIVAAEILKRPDFGHFGKHGKEDYSSSRPTF